MSMTYDEAKDAIKLEMLRTRLVGEKYEDREARVDLINVHATMSKLFDRVCQLERECAELRIGQAQHELANHSERNHVTPLQDRVVAIGRNRRSKLGSGGNIPRSNEGGSCGVGSKSVRSVDVHNPVSLRSYSGFGRAGSSNCTCSCDGSEDAKDKCESCEGHSIHQE